MSKRVHEIAKERGLPAKEVLETLRAAGINVKAVSSSVDEAAAAKALGNGGSRPAANAPAVDAPTKSGEGKSRDGKAAAKPRETKGGGNKAGDGARAPSAEAQAPARQAQAQASAPADAKAAAPSDAKPNVPDDGAGAPADGAADGGQRGGADAPHKRPTRDSLQGERAPGTAGGRRRVVIDSQASRGAPGGGPPPPSNQPPRRQRRGRRRRGVYDEEAESRPSQTAVAEPDVIRINSGSTVKAVAEYLDVSSAEIIKKLMALGEMKTLTQTLSDETITVLASELGQDVEIVHSEDEEVLEPQFDDADEDLVERPPVVTTEAGGITQHIGAYQADHNGRRITFLDTPGHEAFTAMRARGAKVTDIAVLVVAADDGVMPQTKESINHARAAEVPIVVAVNKIDLPNANTDRVKSELASDGLQPEEWGGTTQFSEVSAKQKQNLDDLLERILLVADAELDLRANPSAEASGPIIESRLDVGRGPVATMLIHRGTLKVGDAIVAGDAWGRVRALYDYRGERIEAAAPGEPVEILGFDRPPPAGELGRVVENERRARDLAHQRGERLRREAMAKQSSGGVSLESLFTQMQAGAVQDLNIVIKGDVQGSVEAIVSELGKIQHPEVRVNVIHTGVGGITENDVNLAVASQAMVIGFNVRPSAEVRAVAERAGIEIRLYRVIYQLTEEIEQALVGMLTPVETEAIIGEVEVRALFKVSRLGTIAGCMVTSGLVRRGSSVRLFRDGTRIHETTVAALRRFKDDVREVTEGFECGILLEGFNDLREGDVFEVFETREVERTSLDSPPAAP